MFKPEEIIDTVNFYFFSRSLYNLFTKISGWFYISHCKKKKLLMKAKCLRDSFDGVREVI